MALVFIFAGTYLFLQNTTYYKQLCLFVVCFPGVTTIWLYFPQPRCGL